MGIYIVIVYNLYCHVIEGTQMTLRKCVERLSSCFSTLVTKSVKKMWSRQHHWLETQDCL